MNGQKTEAKERSRSMGVAGQRTEDRTAARRAAVQQALAQAHGWCRPCESRATGHETPLPSDEGRATSNAGPARRPCCADCVFVQTLQDGSRKLLVCTGCPLSPGRLRVTQEAECCRGFQRRRVQTDRTIPPEPAEEGVCYIPLTKGKFAIIDAADYELVSTHKWCASGSGCRTYAYCQMNGKTVALHRFLTNAPKGMVVDHIDGNGLNDRRGNLRVCTQQQNLWNSRPRGKSSRFKGPCWDRQKRRWVVYVRHGGRNIFVGRFRDEVTAALAYDRKAYECFGEYAYLNFPNEIRGRVT